MRKNQYEEALFRCEDDRFEIDMILATTEACMTKLEKYSEELKAMSEEDRGSALMPDGYLGAVSERAILRIYGERGDEVPLPGQDGAASDDPSRHEAPSAKAKRVARS
jgi:paired amphipathic helix protein Sin3a